MLMRALQRHPYRTEGRIGQLDGRSRRDSSGKSASIPHCAMHRLKWLPLGRCFPFQAHPPQPTPRSPSTDYGAFVLSMLSRMNRAAGSIDQRLLRHCLALSSSYLITDTTMDPERGLAAWQNGLSRLVDVVVALHSRGELEVGTVNEASKACSECWTVAGSWREMDECREGVKAVATRLKRLLDENGKTYRGGRIYVP